MPELPWDHDPTIPPEDLDLFHRIAGLVLREAWAHVVVEIDANWTRLSAHHLLLPELLRMRSRCGLELGNAAESLRCPAEAAEVIEQPDEQGGWAHTEQLVRAYLGVFSEAWKVEH